MKRLNEQRNRIYEDLSRYRQIMNYINEQQQGETNYTIQDVQNLLLKKGYKIGNADNYLGNNTLNGILQAVGNVQAQSSDTKATFNPTTTTNLQNLAGTSTSPEGKNTTPPGSGSVNANPRINVQKAGASAGGNTNWTEGNSNAKQGDNMTNPFSGKNPVMKQTQINDPNAPK
jgi:hypothetical protein